MWLWLVLLLLFFPVAVAILLPLWVLTQSTFNLVVILGQLGAIARDRRVRQNHALEHATVNVLEERYGPLPGISGLAQPGGFLLLGPVPRPEEVLSAAREGWRRLQAGQTELALHGRCGTSLAAAGLLFSGAALVVMLVLHQVSLWTVLGVFLVAHFLSRPLGLFLQRHVTTDANVQDLVVEQVELEQWVPGFWWGTIRPTGYFIRTLPASAHWSLRWVA